MARRRWTNEEIAEYRKAHDGFYVNKEDSRILVPKAYGIGSRSIGATRFPIWRSPC